MWHGLKIYFDTENREVLDEAQAKDLCNTCFESTPGNIVSGCEEEFGDCWLLKDITEDVTRKIGMMGRIARRADEEFD